MTFRIETQFKVPDARSVSKRAFFNSLIGAGKVSKVVIVDAYTVDARMSPKQMQKAAELLTNPLIEQSRVADSKYYASRAKFDYAIEISYLPGVTDNVGHTAKETLEDGLRIKFKLGQSVYSSQVFLISSAISRNDIKKLADALHNPLIQKAVIKTAAQFFTPSFSPPKIGGDKGGYGGFAPNLPKVKLVASSKITKVDLNVSDEKLIKLGKLGIPDRDGTRRGPLALNLDYLKAIRDYFNGIKRKPTDVELEMLAQTWSEHCKHIIFNSPIDNIKEGLFRRYIKGATVAIRQQKRGRSSGFPRRPSSGDFCVSVFKDNSGAILFDKDFLITHKVETHNTPSALDPFGGAITGIGGVNRDCLGFGLGAKPIINTYGFCLSHPDDKTKLYRDKDLTQPMLSARRIMDGVVAGINAGGNQSGIPTNSGFMYFDARYRGKPLVFAGTVGLIPRKINGKPSHIKQARPGDYIVMIGGRIGLDGIHGATFSSESLDPHSPATAVQIGDPITQKKFSDAIAKEARDLGLYNSITDCGAGGLSSAVGEMAQQSNGCFVNLDKVLVKYPGLAPWQIWISESQERMILAVPPKNWRVFEGLMKKRGVEASVIGKFTDDGKCVVKFKKQVVMDMNLDFLHNGMPVKKLKTKNVKRKITIQKPKLETVNFKSKILELLADSNITSTAFLANQYDHEVQGGSVLKPLQGKGRVSADATVTRPVLTSKKGIILSQALFPEYSEIDPYYAAALSIDSAIRQAVAAGGNPDYLALLDNFCWCTPEDPERLWQLKQAAKACFDFATAFGTPFISGKDSMYNDFKGFSAKGGSASGGDAKGKSIKISIPPTLLISAIGVVDDISKAVSLDAKLPGDVIYILGRTDDKLIPVVDPVRNYRLYKSLYNAIQNNLVASAISLHHGGLIAGLSKMLIAGGLGAEISFGDLPGSWQENYQALFSESQGRILVSVDPKKSEQFESQMADNIFARIGSVSKKDKLIITDPNGKKIVDLRIKKMEKVYKKTFGGY